MSIDMRKHDHEARNVMDFTTWVSLAFVVVMMFVITRPPPISKPIVSLVFPKNTQSVGCSGYGFDELKIEFDDVLLWNNQEISRLQLEQILKANSYKSSMDIRIHSLASYQTIMDTLVLLQKQNIDYVHIRRNSD